MTTTGYGDITPNLDSTGDIVTAMMLMLAGTSITGIFIALAASRLTRAQWVRLQGLRRVHRRGHIVVCGAGSIGSGVIELLLGFNKRLVVIEANPDTAIVERARDRGFDLLTGDASRDATLDLCNLAAAHGLVALTNVDTLNLEIALGARVRNPDMPIVLRIAEATFAASIAAHFDFKTTFSVAALAGPSFAGLSRLDGARGRISVDGQEFGISEVLVTEQSDFAVWRQAIPLAIGRGDSVRLVRSPDAAKPGDRILLLVPLAPLHDGKQTLAQVAEGVHGGSSRSLSATAG
jgi:voltage-gated potassium channel Kch